METTILNAANALESPYESALASEGFHKFLESVASLGERAQTALSSLPKAASTRPGPE